MGGQKSMSAGMGVLLVGEKERMERESSSYSFPMGGK